MTDLTLFLDYKHLISMFHIFVERFTKDIYTYCAHSISYQRALHRIARGRGVGLPLYTLFVSWGVPINFIMLLSPLILANLKQALFRCRRVFGRIEPICKKHGGKENMQLRKIVGGALGLLMTGASLLSGAWAADLSTWTTDLKPGETIVAVGAKAATGDVVGAINIAARLGQVGTTAAGGAASGAAIADGVQIRASGNDLNMYEEMDQVLTKTIRDTELPTELAASTVTISGTTSDLTQRVILSGGYVGFDYPTSTDTTPYKILRLNQSQQIFNYTAQISPAINLTTGTTLKLGGKSWVVRSWDGVNTLKLLSGNLVGTVTTATPLSLTSGTTTYNISLSQVSIRASDSKSVCLLTVNGQSVTLATTDAPATLTDGNKIGASNIYQGSARATGVDSCEIFLGADEYTFQTGNEVKKGTEAIRGYTGFLTLSGTLIQSITVQFAPTDSIGLKSGEKYTDKLFNTFTFDFEGVADGTDVITIQPDGDTNMKFTFKALSGTQYATSLIADSDCTSDIIPTLGYCSGTTLRALKINENSTGELNGTMIKYDRVVVSKNKYTRILELSDIDTTSSTKSATFTDVGSGKTVKVTFASIPAQAVDLQRCSLMTGSGTVNASAVVASDYGLGLDDGNYKVWLINDNNSATNNYKVLVDINDDGNFSCNTRQVLIYTQGGAAINMSNAVSGNLTGISEEKRESTDTDYVRNITVKIAQTTTDNKIDVLTSPAYTAEWSGMKQTASGASTYKAYTTRGTAIDQDSTSGTKGKATITYSDDSATANVAFGGSSVAIGAAAATAAVTLPTLPSTGLSKLDTEVSAADKTGKNLIVVGGPAINSLAAELLNVTYPTYGNASGIAENGYIIKYYAGKFATGKNAILVAGWEAAQSRDAALKLMAGGLTGTSVTG